MSPIPWFKVDDQLAFNAKVVAAGNSAMGLWVRAGSWSSAQLTDGFIPAHMAIAMANAMANPCDADALVMAGLWDEVDGGYQFHDWADFQPDAEAERKKRKARSEAGRKGAAARWNSKTDESHGNSHSKSHGKTVANEMANECDRNAPSRPDPSTEAKASVGARKRATRIPDDWTPSDDLANAMYAECPTVDQHAELRKFKDYWQSQPDSKARKTDWDATYRNWIRRAGENAPKSANRATDRMRAGYDAMASYHGPEEDPWTRKAIGA
ncbi:hypothetical protein [Arthrobacter sp. USHLN218]|uniref:hypothetical protein n=1 Tax=Arthrobacter sp. USHLN218 TaxID=3081232 RepID=UPI0030159ABE